MIKINTNNDFKLLLDFLYNIYKQINRTKILSLITINILKQINNVKRLPLTSPNQRLHGQDPHPNG